MKDGYPNNGAPPEQAHETDELLLYRAKANVRDKRNLLRHVLVWVAAWLPLGVLFYWLRNISHPATGLLTNRIDTMRDTLDSLARIPNLPHIQLTTLETSIWSQVSRPYIPPVWYVVVGVMLAWGAWILFRVAKRLAPRVKKALQSVRARGKTVAPRKKPDPVMQEYRRLKGLEETE